MWHSNQAETAENQELLYLRCTSFIKCHYNMIPVHRDDSTHSLAYCITEFSLICKFPVFVTSSFLPVSLAEQISNALLTFLSFQEQKEKHISNSYFRLWCGAAQICAYSLAKAVKHCLGIGENQDLKELIESKQCFYIIFSE